MNGTQHPARLQSAALAALLLVALTAAVFGVATRARAQMPVEDAQTPASIAKMIEAITVAFAAELRGPDTPGITAPDDATIAVAIAELRSCLEENQLSLLASTALDPDMLRASPPVLLARLLENRDEPVRTCVVYRIEPHRVGIDRTPPLVAAFLRVMPDVLDAAELSLADPRDLGDLAVVLPARDGPPRVSGTLRYCVSLPHPGAYVVTLRTADGRELRDQARYYEAAETTAEPRGGCHGAVVPGPEGDTCLRLYYARRRGEERRTETCFEVRGVEPPSAAPGP